MKPAPRKEPNKLSLIEQLLELESRLELLDARMALCIVGQRRIKAILGGGLKGENQV